MVPPCSDRVSRAPPYSRIHASTTPTGLSPTAANLSRLFGFSCTDHWPAPRSLATTSGISVDVFSSPYLDVSVQAVPHVHLFDSMHVTGVLLQWVSPFGNLRIKGYLLLPEAYRSLSRLSSALSAKASALCPYCLTFRFITLA